MNIDISNEKLHEKLDTLIKEVVLEMTRLVKENKMLQEECNALRDQLKYAESRVYSGNTY